MRIAAPMSGQGKKEKGSHNAASSCPVARPF